MGITLSLEANGSKYRVEVVDYELEARIRINDYTFTLHATPEEILLTLQEGRLKAIKTILHDKTLLEALEKLACLTGKKIRVRFTRLLPTHTIECRKD